MKNLLYTVMTTFILIISSNNCLAYESMQENNTIVSSANKPSKSRLWNLQDADILSIINEVSRETGKNFVVDPKVTGKISLISSKPIKSKEVYQLFLSVLELLGYSAIPNGNVIKIIPSIEGAELASRVASKNFPGKGDEVVVRIFPLKNINANQLIPVLRPLLPQWSNVSAYTPGNVLIVLGRAANLKRIDKIIREIDSASKNEVDIVKLRHTSAVQISTVLTNLQNASRASGETPLVSIAHDERSNSILLSGNKSARIKTRMLIKHLDTPSSGVQGSTQVIYLKYLQAKNFAPILGKIAQNISNKNNNSSPTITTYNIKKTSKSQSENKTDIQAEPNTNAIIITAPPRMMKALTSIISKLDIRPAQVLVEGIIVEIGQDDTKNLGIQWGALSSAEHEASLVSAGFNPLGLGSVGIIPSTQIQAILGILQEKTGIDILSTPSIVVLDNQKASLAVGTQVTDQTGSYATTGNATTATPFNTFNRLNVELKLEVTPQINLGEAVRLKIVLKNDSLKNPDNPGLNPTVNTSQITNSVIVNSKDILVLGGLISNNITDTVEKIPLLGDIPVLGYLFQHKTRRLEKKNLMVFIKPTIVHDSVDAESITHTKYDLSRKAQIKWPEDLSEQGKQKLENILQPWKNNVKIPKPFDKDEDL
ncbi:type II secretion system secretin GspD [Gammaproteobacteria bacterium]|nr:type II secretion system secretin GspD [Gammaproteobacteria bacterium]